MELNQTEKRKRIAKRLRPILEARRECIRDEWFDTAQYYTDEANQLRRVASVIARKEST